MSSAKRIAWVDHAKGICIILVVLMHSTYGVALKTPLDQPWLVHFSQWASPFRMPDFFLISGLFLYSRINWPWGLYIDRKVIHFLYFYMLWMPIQIFLHSYSTYKAGGFSAIGHEFAIALIDPFGTLWFIYMLAMFFVVVKVTKHVPAVLMLMIGALLESLKIHTGWMVIDEFASRFIYFYAGYYFSTAIFAWADWWGPCKSFVIVMALIIWASVNGYCVALGWNDYPGISLVLGFAGALAIITLAVLLTRLTWALPIRIFGTYSLIIYLAFFIFMAGTRGVLVLLAGRSIAPIVVLSIAVFGAALLVTAIFASQLKSFKAFLKRCDWGLPPVQIGPKQFLQITAFLSIGFELLALTLGQGILSAPDVIVLYSATAGVVGPLGLYILSRHTWSFFLFHRPAWARLEYWTKNGSTPETVERAQVQTLSPHKI